MNQVESHGPEQNEIPRPHDIVMPSATLWGIKSGGRVGIFPYMQTLPYLNSIDRTLANAHASPRSSSLADIAEVARGEDSRGFRLTKMMPWAFPQEIRELTREASEAVKRRDKPSLSYEYYRSFMEGSDFDARIAVKPEDMKSWTEQLVKDTIGKYRINKSYKDVPEITGDGKVIWTIPLDEAPIQMHPRTSLAYGTRSQFMDTAIRITYKVFPDSHIPACDWQLIAIDRNYDSKYPELANIPLVTVGISPKSDMLTPDQQKKDTRMGPKVNSYDAITNVTLSEEVPPGVQGDVASHQSGLYADISKNGLISLPPFRETVLVTGTDGITRCVYNPNFVHTFITLTNEQATTLNNPVAFGSDFGAEYVAPESTLIEGFRVIRKGLRYNGIETSEHTEKAMALIASDTLRQKLVPSSDTERPEWWQKEITREAATAAWISPREFIRLGDTDRYNLAQYFPNWRYLREIFNLLPTHEEIEHQIISISETGNVDTGDIPRFLETLKKQGLSAAMDLKKSADSAKKEGERVYAGGWKIITNEVRRLNEAKKGNPDYNLEIAGRNDLELIFWLLQVKF